MTEPDADADAVAVADADVKRRAESPSTAMETRMRCLKYGHKGILSMDLEAKMESTTTNKTDFIPPKGPGIRLRGVRREALEEQIAELVSRKLEADRNPPIPKSEFASTTRTDFTVEGFVSRRPPAAQQHDYTKEPAITFWRDNYQRVQGLTPMRTPLEPFRKSSLFSTPITQRLDELDI